MSAPAPSELPSYRGYRYPEEIISHAVWLYFRFKLRRRGTAGRAGRDCHVRDDLGLVLEIRPKLRRGLRRRRARMSDKWHLDELQLKINGKRHWLWRAVDMQDVLDILIQQRRDQQAADLRRVLAPAGCEPRVVITDKIARTTRQPSDEYRQLLSTDGTRGSTIDPRTRTSRRVNVSEPCGGPSRLSRHSAFSDRSELSAIISEPAGTASRRLPDDNSWRNGATSLKRAGYGRAKLPLLRARILGPN